MSGDPNELAWKGSPTPWHTTRRIGQTTAWDIYDAGKEIRLGFIHSNVMGPDRIEANAHMAGAAPEAVEFIADLIPELDLLKASGLFDAVVVEKWISRAEEILKKAYNH